MLLSLLLLATTSVAVVTRYVCFFFFRKSGLSLFSVFYMKVGKNFCFANLHTPTQTYTLATTNTLRFPISPKKCSVAYSLEPCDTGWSHHEMNYPTATDKTKGNFCYKFYSSSKTWNAAER